MHGTRVECVGIYKLQTMGDKIQLFSYESQAQVENNCSMKRAVGIIRIMNLMRKLIKVTIIISYVDIRTYTRLNNLCNYEVHVHNLDFMS